MKAGKTRGVILGVSTRCFLDISIFPQESIIHDHLPVGRHSVQVPIWQTLLPQLENLQFLVLFFKAKVLIKKKFPYKILKFFQF